MLSKFLDPKNDFIFKRIFGSPTHKDILIHFLNDMIDFKDGAVIQTIEFLKTSHDPEIAFAKQSIVDVLCTDQKGRKYIVEMQVANTDSFVKRAQYYAAKAYASQMNQGDRYHNLKEIIFLAITDFVMFPDKPEYKSDHIILDKISHAHDLKDFYFCFLELPKFKKQINELTTLVEKWAYFFKYAPQTTEKDLKTIIGKDLVIEQAYEALNQFAWSPEDLHLYEEAVKRERDAKSILERQLAEVLEKGMQKGIEKGMEKGIQKGMEKGIEKGSKNTALQIAQKMIVKGIDLDQIKELTGLSSADITQASE